MTTTSTDFWKGAGERAGKTFLQVGVATLGISAGATYSGEAALHLPWETALVTAFLSALLSLVTSLLNPSFTAGTTTVPTAAVDPLVDPGLPEETSAGLDDPGLPETDETVAAAAADYTPEHAADASVVPDGEGVATS